MEFVNWLAIGATLLGILISSIIAYLVFFSTRQSQRAELHREIGHLYDKAMDFRAEHPEVLKMSRHWDATRFADIYRQENREAEQWVIYYTYVEYCLDFCNSVIFGRDLGLLNKDAYEKHYKLLVKLLLTEHYLFVQSVIHGKYLSRYVLAFIDQLEKEGWDWPQMHKALAGS